MHAYSSRDLHCDTELLSGSTNSRLPAYHVLQENALFDDSVYAQPHAQNVAASDGACMHHTSHPSAATMLGADTLHVGKLQQAGADAQPNPGTPAILACWQRTAEVSTATSGLTFPPQASHNQTDPHSGMTNAEENAHDASMQTEEHVPGRSAASVAVSIDSTEAALQELLADHKAVQTTSSSVQSTAGTESTLQDLLADTLSIAESIEQTAVATMRDPGGPEPLSALALLAAPDFVARGPASESSSDHTATLMRAMLELDKLTQELKRRCVTSSGEKTVHIEETAATEQQEPEVSGAFIPDRFREELVNKLTAVLPAPYTTATDKQMHAKV